MGTISGMGFAQALVHTVHSTRAFGTRAMNCMHLCLCKTHSRDCPHAEIRHSLIAAHYSRHGEKCFPSYRGLCVNEIIRHHLHIVDYYMLQFDKFFSKKINFSQQLEVKVRFCFVLQLL